MARVLTKDFYNRSTLIVAEELMGKFLVRQRDDGTQITFMIKEVEAYDGFQDQASHAYRGMTDRTRIMFGPAGFWYVYFIYGVHWMLNIVTGPENYPAAILIRTIGDYNGPGKLTRALKIDKSFNALPAVPSANLWIEDRGVKPLNIVRTPRIGVSYAGDIWSQKPYRFIME